MSGRIAAFLKSVPRALEELALAERTADTLRKKVTGHEGCSSMWTLWALLTSWALWKLWRLWTVWALCALWAILAL